MDNNPPASAHPLANPPWPRSGIPGLRWIAGNRHALLAFLIVLAVWQISSAYVPEYIFPGIPKVFDKGVALLKEFERLGMVLDVTHLSDTSMAEALEVFSGPVLASHHNCRVLVPGDRQLTDGQVRRLVSRDAVIGVALDAWMLHPGWERGRTSPQVVGLEACADHIDHVCQLAGTTRHSGIGSDLDGGFGTEQTPHDLDTIADLQKLAGILDRRGYKRADVEAIFHGNFLRLFTQALPHE